MSLLQEFAIMFSCTVLLGTMLGQSWSLGKRFEFRERLKKATSRPRKKAPSMGDVNWALYLRDVNDTRDHGKTS